jgi:hypothetical protein
MSNITRYKILAILAITLIASLLLSIGLGNLEFKPGQPFVGGSESTTMPDPVKGAKVSTGGQLLPFIQGAAAFLFIVLLFYLAINLISAVGFKRILKSAAALAVSLAVLVLLPRISPPDLTVKPADPVGIEDPPVFEYAVTPLGTPPQSLVWLVIIILAAAIFGLGIWLFIRRKRSPEMLDRLRQEAEDAVHALQNGADIRNTIVRCYIQMSQALQEERGIERGISVTPHEFIELLLSKGLPGEPVRLLTHLFETVRYGNQSVSMEDENRAMESLNAIIATCKGIEQTS